MDVEALKLARAMNAMARAAAPAELASVFLRFATEAQELTGGCCYWRDAAGQALLPLARSDLPVETLPAIPMSELDNPLVYSLMGAHPYLVTRIGDLINVGESYERLRSDLKGDEAMQVFPLQDHKRRPAGVIVLIGPAHALHAWNQSDLCQLMLQTYDQLGARLCEQSGVGDIAQQVRTLEAQRENERGRARSARLLAAGFVGVSAVAKTLRNEMLRLAESSLSLLIIGETGAGKDHAAWLIHQTSAREGKFIPVNCAAIPKDLIEAELFGVVRGAFTGATHARNGLVAEAHGGTLFLDEIGDMPLELQGTLLRLLNEKKYRPVGATRELGSDFRLICATHRPLPELVRNGLFREDLYFRIRQQVLHLPPLRERPEDIPALVSFILLNFNRERQTNVSGVSARAMTRLRRHSFPGNIRELRTLIQVAAERTESGSEIRSSTLAGLQEDLTRPLRPLNSNAAFCALWDTDNLPEALLAFEQALLRDRLHKAAGSRRLAAESLGIPKRTLARKCQAWKLDVEYSTT